MNRIFKVVWNRTRNAYTCVSEIARSHSAGGRRTGRVLAAGIMAALLMGTVPAWATDVAPYTTDNQMIYSGNIMTIDDTKAVISNTDSSLTMRQITKGDKWDNILGGGAFDQESGNNHVTVKGTEVSTVDGGQAETVQKNTILLDNSTADEVSGGYGGSVSSNTVTLQNKSTAALVYGGQADMKGNAEGNTVILDDASGTQVFGGYADGGDASSNTVELKNGSTAGTVYGGMAYDASTGSADKNTVTLTDSTAKSDVYGGFVMGTGTASENKVTIENSTVERANMVAAGFTNDAGGDIRDNTLTLSGNTSVNAQFTIAGFHYSGGSGNPVSYVVSGNKLLMNGESGDTLKLSALNAGGFALYGNAENNELTVSGGVSVQPLSDSGADEVKPQLYGGAAVDGNSTGNKVTISTTGEMKLASIIGGSTLSHESDGSGLQVTDNSVTISSGDISITGITDGIGIRGGYGIRNSI